MIPLFATDASQGRRWVLFIDEVDARESATELTSSGFCDCDQSFGSVIDDQLS